MMHRPSYYDSPFYNEKKNTLSPDAPQEMKEEYLEFQQSSRVATIEDVKNIKTLHPRVIEAVKRGEVMILS